MKASSFAQRLRDGLDFRQMTQAELAAKSKISKSSISHYIKGDWEGKQDAVYAIAKALNVSEAWLMGYDVSIDGESPAPAGLDESGYDLDAKEKALLSAFNELTEEGKDLSIEYTQMLGTQNKYKKFTLQDAESVG